MISPVTWCGSASPGKVFTPSMGFCSSAGPCTKTLVILNGDQDARSVPCRARTRRQGQERLGGPIVPIARGSYCTPIIIDAAGQEAAGPQRPASAIASYDRNTGQNSGGSSTALPNSFVASLVFSNDIPVHDGRLSDLPCPWGIRPDGAGQPSPTRNVLLAQARRRWAYVPSPIAYDKYLYVVER